MQSKFFFIHFFERICQQKYTQNIEIQSKLQNLDNSLNYNLAISYKNPFKRELRRSRWQQRVLKCITDSQISADQADELLKDAAKDKIQLAEKSWLEVVYNDYNQWQGRFKQLIVCLGIEQGIVEEISCSQFMDFDNFVSKFELIKNRRRENALKKPSVEDMEQLKEDGLGIQISVQSELSHITKELLKYSQWRNRYLNCLQNRVSREEFEELFNYGLHELRLYGKEVQDSLDVYQDYELWIGQIYFIKKYVDGDSLAWPGKASLEQLQYLHEKSKTFPFSIAEDTQFQVLIQEALKIQEDLQSFQETEFDEEQYLLKMQQLDVSHFTFAQQKQLISKLEKHSEILESLSKKVDLEELENHYASAIEGKFEQKIIEQLQKKIRSGNEIKAKMEEMIKTRRIDEEDFGELRKWQKELLAAKVTLKKEGDLYNNIKKSIEWLKNVYILFKQLNDQTADNTLKIAQIHDTLSNSLLNSEIDMAKDHDRIAVLVKEGGKIDHVDCRMIEIFQLLGQMLWEYDVNKMFSKSDISTFDITNLKNQGGIFCIAQSENQERVNLFKRVVSVFDKWQQWKQLYESLFANGISHPVFEDQEQFAPLKQTILELRGMNVEVSVKRELEHLKHAEQVMQWTEHVNTQILQSDKVDFNNIKEQLENSKSLYISEYSKTKKLLQKLYEESSILKNEFYKYKQLSTKIISFFSKVNSSSKVSRQELDDKNNEKYSKGRITDLINEMGNSSVCFEAEISEIQANLSVLQQLNNQLEEFLETHRIADSLEPNALKKIQEIKLQLLQNVTLCQPKLLEKIYIYEIQYHAVSYLNKSKQGGILKWQKIIQHVDQLNNSEIKKQDWYRQVIFQVHLASLIIQEYTDLKRTQEELKKNSENSKKIKEIRRQLIDLETIGQYLQRIDECLIQLQEEKSYFLSFKNRQEEITTEYQQVMSKTEKPNNEKINETLFKALNEKLQKVPIFFTEEPKIEEILQSQSKLKNLIEEYEELRISESKLPTEGNYQQAVNLIERYKIQPIYNKYIDELNSLFEFTKEIIQSCQELDINNFEVFSTQVECFEKISPKFRVGEQYSNLKFKIWNCQIDVVRKAQLSKNMVLEQTKIISLLNEGYEILVFLLEKNSSEMIQEMKKNITFIEGLVTNLNKKLEEFNQIKDPGLIQKDYKFDDFVDLYQVLAEYSIELQSNENTQIFINKNLVKDAYKDLMKFRSSIYIQNQVVKRPVNMEPEKPRQDPPPLPSMTRRGVQENLNPRKALPGGLPDTGNKMQSKELDEREKMGKRKIKHITNEDFFYEFSTKKPRIDDDVQTVISISDPLPAEEEEMIDNNVRSESKLKLSKFFTSNAIFSEEKKAELLMKNLEERLFGIHHASKLNYQKSVQDHVQLFKFLLKLPNVSICIKDKNFEFAQLNKMIAKMSQLETLEEKILSNKKSTLKKPVLPPKEKFMFDPSPVKNQSIREEPEIIKKQKIVQKNDPLLNILKSIEIQEKKQPQEQSGLARLIGDAKNKIPIIETSKQKNGRDRDRQKKRDRDRDHHRREKHPSARFSDDEESVRKGDESNSIQGETQQYNIEQDFWKLDEKINQDTTQKHTLYQPFMYDPDQEKKPSVVAKQVVVPEQPPSKDFPKGSIFFIGDVKLRFHKNSKTQVCKFYSSDDYKQILRFPEIDLEIKQSLGLVKQSDCLNYIEKHLNKRELVIMKGWMELIDEDQSHLSQLSKKMDEIGNFAGFKINNATINMLTMRQSQTLNKTFKMNITEINPDSLKLAFITYIKRDNTAIIDSGKKLDPQSAKPSRLQEPEVIAPAFDHYSSCTDEEDDRPKQVTKLKPLRQDFHPIKPLKQIESSQIIQDFDEDNFEDGPNIDDILMNIDKVQDNLYQFGAPSVHNPPPSNYYQQFFQSDSMNTHTRPHPPQVHTQQPHHAQHPMHSQHGMQQQNMQSKLQNQSQQERLHPPPQQQNMQAQQAQQAMHAQHALQAQQAMQAQQALQAQQSQDQWSIQMDPRRRNQMQRN